MPKHAHIFYYGKVQGVGFRFNVHRLAMGRNLTGWVRNCADGSVEIRAEGDEEAIRNLCQDIETYFKGHIIDKKIAYEPARHEFKDFRVSR